VPHNLLELTPQEISLALLALHENWQSPPENLQHLSTLDWMILEGVLNQLLLQRRISVLH
jgi:hypothetical protein